MSTRQDSNCYVDMNIKINSLDDSKDNVENKTSQFSPDFLNLETQ